MDANYKRLVRRMRPVLELKSERSGKLASQRRLDVVQKKENGVRK